MLRLLGFLIGSVVSIGMLLLILGIPDITMSREMVEQIEFDDVIDQIDLDSVPAAIPTWSRHRPTARVYHHLRRGGRGHWNSYHCHIPKDTTYRQFQARVSTPRLGISSEFPQNN